MEFSRQEYGSGWPCPSPGDLPNPGIEPRSPMLQADSLQSEPNTQSGHQSSESSIHHRVPTIRFKSPRRMGITCQPLSAHAETNLLLAP